jgi:hypothetical protein
MKKIILCLIAIFSLLGLKAQYVEGEYGIFRTSIALGDSLVTKVYEDTLVNPAFVRTYVANNSPSAASDTLFISGPDKWVGNNDTIDTVAVALVAVNASADSSWDVATVNDTLKIYDAINDDYHKIYNTGDNTFVLSNGYGTDSILIGEDGSGIYLYSSFGIRATAPFFDFSNLGTTKSSGYIYTGTTDPTNTFRANFDGSWYATVLGSDSIKTTNQAYIELNDTDLGSTMVITRPDGANYYKIEQDYPLYIITNNDTSIFDGEVFYSDTITAVKGEFDTVSITQGLSIGGGDVLTSSDTIPLKDAVEAEQFSEFNFKDATFATQSDGRLYKDEGTQSLIFQNDVTGFNHNLGYEFVRRVYNGTGVTIPSLRAVRKVGTYSNGDIIASVALAGNTTYDSAKVYGITTVSIAPGTVGIITRGGDIRGENTTSINDTAVYLGFGGILVDTCPNPPYLCVPLGECIYSDNDSGQVDVDIKEISYSPSPLFVADTSGINQDVTINTQNVYEYLPLGDCNIDNNFGFTVTGDSVQVGVGGYYQIVLSMSFQGNPTTEVWQYAIFNNNIELPYKERSTSSSATGDVNLPISRNVNKDDWISFRIKNTSGTGDPTIQTIAVQILFLHE